VNFIERFVSRRPRILNVLHSLRIVRATSPTTREELAAIARYAAGAKVAVEIGSSTGVSAVIIARSLSLEGHLFCVDPWNVESGTRDPVFDIFRRRVRRAKMGTKIAIIRDFSSNASHQLPNELDFAFIDGDHSWKGIETDWTIVSGRIIDGGVVCLHDTAVPLQEPWRTLDSCRFYDAIISRDLRFELIDTIHSMQVLRRKG